MNGLSGPPHDLVMDIRKIMEPNTAARLKVILFTDWQERKNNKLKDFLAMAVPLGISHLLVVTQKTAAPLMKIVRSPRGPTLTFRVESYSLAKDVIAAQKKARTCTSAEYTIPPLVLLYTNYRWCWMDFLMTLSSK